MWCCRKVARQQGVGLAAGKAVKVGKLRAEAVEVGWLQEGSKISVNCGQSSNG